jgi:hypothetical protein
MSKKLIAITLLALSFVLVNCKDNNDPEPEKTLNKSLMTDKYWKTNMGTQFEFDHYFRSDGMYTSQDGKMVLGKWNWLNNSDSLFVDDNEPLLLDITYIVEYCTETELKMRRSGDPKGSGNIYYKQ